MNKKTKIIIACVVCIVLAVFIGVKIIWKINNTTLDSSEEYVLDCVRMLCSEKGRISLENDILYFETTENTTCVIIEFSSSSGQETAYFVNKSFIGTNTDYERIKNYDYDDVKAGRISKNEYSKILEQQMGFSDGRIALTLWDAIKKSGGSGTETAHLVSAKKIGRKLGISYL
jgi:hypothetical protein